MPRLPPVQIAVEPREEIRKRALTQILEVVESLQEGESFAVERPVKKDSTTPLFILYFQGTVRVNKRR